MNNAGLRGCGVCLRTAAWLSSPFRTAVAQARRLREIEQLGVSGA
jgi:hypothetical protein